MMSVEILSNSEMMNMNKEQLELLKDIVDCLQVETIDLENNTVIVNKKLLANNIVDELVIDKIVDRDSLDEIIWKIIDNIGDEIRGLAYDYAQDNRIIIR